jgi:cytoskeletal protein RodZ
MSDDLFEGFGDDDLFEEEEETTQEAEGQNRTFIIAVAALGGLLLCSLIAFGVWAFVLNRPQPADVAPTETPIPTEDVSAELTATAESVAATKEAEPTETPEPTATPVVGPTATPTEEAEGEGEAAGEAEPTATQPPRRTPTPTQMPSPTPTPLEGSDAGTGFGAADQLADTGLGEWLMVGAAVVLIAVMVLARKMRGAS